jgi:iron complex transport system substrate-binding protein
MGEDARIFLPLHRGRFTVWLGAVACVGIIACAPTNDSPSNRVETARSATSTDTDDFGAVLPTDASFATRVVSLNPAATEVIFAIGADSLLVGRSAWDEFPAEAMRIPALGDGIRPNVEAVLRAKPTLVILYATAENRAAADALTRAGVRTIALRVDHIAQFASLTLRLGRALGATGRATSVVDSVQHTLDQVRAVTRDAPRRNVVWPVWQQPVMVIGRGSYLDELIEIAGGTNVFHDLEAPSPPVSIEEIARRNPDLVVATARSARELAAKPQWRAVAAVRDGHFALHDPSVTGRPSVVLGMAAVALARVLHPELSAKLPALAPALPPATSTTRPVIPR